jgi:hypothetical protein
MDMLPENIRGLLSFFAPSPKGLLPEQQSVRPYNNPGNLKRSQNWAGMIPGGYGKNNDFAIFDSPQMGLRALMRDVTSKIKNQKGDLRKMISRFAPKSENPTDNYYEYVLSKVGKNKVTTKDLPNIVKGIVEFENTPGSDKSKMYLDPSVFNEALKLSKKSMPEKTSLSEARKIIKGG